MKGQYDIRYYALLGQYHRPVLCACNYFMGLPTTRGLIQGSRLRTSPTHETKCIQYFFSCGMHACMDMHTITSTL